MDDVVAQVVADVDDVAKAGEQDGPGAIATVDDAITVHFTCLV